jgi:hypothetical protein
VGADHKGPLAAFVVIAVVAAVLLVTSVRSQADPAWLRHLVAEPAAPGVMPAGVQHPAAPSATATSSSTGTADPTSGGEAPVGTSSQSSQHRAAHAPRVGGTARHADQGTVTQGATDSDPTSDPTDAPSTPLSTDAPGTPTTSEGPGLPGSGLTDQDGIDQDPLPTPGPGLFLWLPHGGWPTGWPAGWPRWASSHGDDHPWGAFATRRHLHRTH